MSVFKRYFSIGLALSGMLCLASVSTAQLRYEQEYPVIGYTTSKLTDPVTQMVEAVAQGNLALEYTEEHGYLASVLDALGIDPSSQLLIYSHTALKKRFVNAETPRAIYFTDNAYVAYIQNSRSLELSAMDPNVGSVFFVLSQNPEDEIEADRQLNRCLRCHDSYSLSGGGVPRFLLSSVLAWPDGEIISHELSIITNTSTPIDERWGGWFVTGTHGEQEHRGNLLFKDASMLSSIDLSLTGNRTDISDLVNVEPYLNPSSDIVALLVLEHQIEVQNHIIKVNYGVRTVLDEEGSISDEQLQTITEPLLLSLLMVDEAPFASEIKGVSGFTEYFQALGPMDSEGRSLRELDLVNRTFKYPLSYQIYTEAFDALPAQARAYIYKRLNEVLSGEDTAEEFAHLSMPTRKIILEILSTTKEDFLTL